jgi:cell division transport system permease protein
MKNVGATNWFIRGPLLLQGILIGCISALIALGVTFFVYREFVATYGSQVAALMTMEMVSPEFMLINLAWIFAALGASIGAFGSIISMRKFLKA